ncbi:MAG TPA: hypothetical protein VLR46_14385, partial [Candidatus Dormibacteraeota bacterium]|nr:hypothetical protein [Candidatus Dormibacteraeota bacterium]
VELIGIGEALDLSSLARSLRGPLSQGQGEGKGLPIFSMEDSPARYRNGQAPQSGFVLVTPVRISKGSLAPVQELISISGRPLLGVIAHKAAQQERTSIPATKPSPRLSVLLDADKDSSKGMSKEMQSDLWGAQ